MSTDARQASPAELFELIDAWVAVQAPRGSTCVPMCARDHTPAEDAFMGAVLCGQAIAETPAFTVRAEHCRDLVDAGKTRATVGVYDVAEDLSAEQADALAVAIRRAAIVARSWAS
ncbi:hypothetical protein [Nocardioides sp.]|uniref:hypothetical protein n=1 Tax=Nocardioides sp. TaxID=35761 RepID=UPI0031FE83F3|nr:hypothetical protein [Nocardioides sp.]